MKHWSWDGSMGNGPQKRAVVSACSGFTYIARLPPR